MKYTIKTSALLLLTFIPVLAFSQKYKRNTFKYEKMQSENFAECDEAAKSVLEKSLVAIEENNSTFAVSNAKVVYDGNKDCFMVYDIYGYSLFRNGQWFEGLEIIEAGIEKFGAVPNLIERKYLMSLEMAQLGTGQKSIDGSSVFKANSIQYNEEQFVAENYKSVLLDLKYLIANYNRPNELFYAAKVHQILEQYEESNAFFSKLLDNEDYKMDAVFNMADNFIAQNKLNEAENELNKLLLSNPKAGVLYEKLAEVYKKKGDSAKAKECQQKAIYYKNVPFFSNLDFSEENYGTLIFFGRNEDTAAKKLEKLNAIKEKGNTDYTIDVCLIILKIHTNHGNGVEERATEILAEIGKPAIEKVDKLFQTDVSTCTITNLAEVMSEVKAESSWELMKQYLPNIANMPMTMVPPNLPEKMIQFDEEKGLKEILIVVKPLLTAKKDESDNPMADLQGFGQYVYYAPLKKINGAKLKTVAKGLGYSDEEFKLLKAKID